MNRDGLIYELTDKDREVLSGIANADVEIDAAKVAELREDVARLDGFLRGRAESDAKRGPGANKDLAG